MDAWLTTLANSTRTLPEHWQPRRIAILRALHLGDLLLAVPALRALRKRFPQAEITLIGLPWATSFVQRYQHYLDRFVEFGGYPGIIETPIDTDRMQRFLDEQRAYGYDLAIQMHGSGNASNPCTLTIGAQITVGYYTGTRPVELDIGVPYPDDQHEIVRNLGLAALCGSSDLSTRLEFPLYEEDHAEAAILLRSLPHAKRPWIGLHAGAHSPARRWPAEHFATVADALAKDAQILLTGGPGEGSIVQAVIEHMHTQPLNLAGKTSQGGLAALLSKLDLFISNDTGPAHIAHALNCPNITLYGPADYTRWRPLEGERTRALRHPVPCSPCSFWECPIDHRCLRWLEPARVLHEAEQLLHMFSSRTNLSHTPTSI
jgi:ADP-heptose:LPS heptosyltransferase